MSLVIALTFRQFLAGPAPMRGDPFLGPVQGSRGSFFFQVLLLRELLLPGPAPEGGGPVQGPAPMGVCHGRPDLASIGGGPVLRPIICAERPQVLMSTFFFLFSVAYGRQFTRNDDQTNFFVV